MAYNSMHIIIRPILWNYWSAFILKSLSTKLVYNEFECKG